MLESREGVGWLINSAGASLRCLETRLILCKWLVAFCWAGMAPCLGACGGDTQIEQSGGGRECDCYGNIYDCRDFPTQVAAQACLEACRDRGMGDIHRLDADRDDIACEWNP